MLLQAKSILAASSQKNKEDHPTTTEVASMSTSTSTDSDSSSSSSSMRNSSTNHHGANSTTKRGGHAPTAGPAPVLSSFGTNNSSSSSDYDDGNNNNNNNNTTMIPNNDVSSSLLKGVRENDVLCGRSEVSHIGNKKYRRIIEDHREAYQNASSRRKKTELSYKIIVAIRATGGRFLKMDDESSSNGKNTTTTIGKWMELDDKQAKEKVSHALRSAKDPDRPRQRKPRVVKKHVPTAKEKMLYHHILRDQQELFRVMMKKEGCDVKDLVLR